MTNLVIDDGSVRWAVDGRGCDEEQALTALASRPLLVLMHGYGSFEGDLIELAARLPHGFVYASPRAPLVAPPPVVGGFAWWVLPFDANGMPMREPDPELFVDSPPHLAAVAALDWLDSLDRKVSERSEHGKGLGTIALMGFSQGGCMVTSMLRMRPERFACGVNCSGFVAAGAFDDSAIAATQPPMFWGRDEGDPIISKQMIARTAEWAPTHTTLEARLYPGIEHSISLEELEHIVDFLNRHVVEGVAGSR